MKMAKFLIPLLLVTIAIVFLIFSFAIVGHSTKSPKPTVTDTFLKFEMMKENKTEARIYAEIENLPMNSMELDYDDLLNSSGEIIELPSDEPSPFVLELWSSDILNTSVDIYEAKNVNPLFDVVIEVSLKILSDDGNEESLIRTILTNKISVLYLLIDGANNTITLETTGKKIALFEAVLSNGVDNVICLNTSCIILGKGSNDIIKKASPPLEVFKDRIFGGSGNDIIESLFIETEDNLYGGPGEDTLKGGKWGKNNFYSSSPNDVSIGQCNDFFSGPGQKVITE